MRLSILLAVALAAGCVQIAPSASEDAGPEPASARPASFEVTADPSHARLGPNETVSFRLTLRALESVAVDHPTLGEGGWLRARLEGPNGERVSLYPYGEGYGASPDAIERFHLEPGTVEHHTVHWNGRTEPREPEPHGGPPAAPGNWTLVVSIRGVGEWGPVAHFTLKPAYEFTLEPANATLHAGTPQAFNLTLRVHENVTFVHPYKGCGSWFQVRVPTGLVSEPPITLYEYGGEAYVCIAAIGPVTLSAGTVIRESVHWNGHANTSMPDPHAGQALEPGEYHVVARLRGTDDTRTATVHLLGDDR